MVRCRRTRNCGWVLLVLTLSPLMLLYIKSYSGGVLDLDKSLRDTILHREAFQRIHLLKHGNKSLIRQQFLIPSPRWQYISPTKEDLGILVVTDPNAPQWQKNLKEPQNKKHYFLSQALQVRIYAHDKAKWTVAELKQWMHYMFYTGVEHIYLCDHHQSESERLEKALNRYIQLGLVSYIPWSRSNRATTEQIKCYQHVIDNFHDMSTWQIAIDMDEYPYIATDTEEGFLRRYLELQSSDVAEISMHNFIMMGQGDRTKNMTIDRINRRTPREANNLDKPIYRPERVRAGMHHNTILRGNRIEVVDGSLIMLHYWGARTQNWGPDTQETLSKTIIFNDMREKIAPKIRHSLIIFREHDVFSNSTGP